MARDAGRDPDTLDVSIYGCRAMEMFEGYRDAGVDRAVFGLAPEDRDATLSRLDKLARLFSAITAPSLSLLRALTRRESQSLGSS